MMFSLFDSEIHLSYLRGERLREAQTERLLRQGASGPPRLRVRRRLALLLYALADRLECPPAPTPARGTVR